MSEMFTRQVQDSSVLLKVLLNVTEVVAFGSRPLASLSAQASGESPSPGALKPEEGTPELR